MSKLIATLVASLFAAAAFAQTGGVPPTQPAAGTTASTGVTTTSSTPDASTSPKKAARAARSKARKAKRDAVVGAKPLN